MRLIQRKRKMMKTVKATSENLLEAWYDKNIKQMRYEAKKKQAELKPFLVRSEQEELYNFLKEFYFAKVVWESLLAAFEGHEDKKGFFFEYAE